MSWLPVFRRELLACFFSPLAWIVLTLFLAVQGYSFYLFVELASQPITPHGAVLQYFFGGTLLYWLFLILLVAVMTMRLLAEERRSGTLELLMTAPVTETGLVLGKYAAAATLFAFLWLPTLIYVMLIRQLSSAGEVGWGPVAAGYLGTLLSGLACLAVGLLCSALARHQITAALLTLLVLSLLLLLGPLTLFVHQPQLRAVMSHANLFDHLEDFGRGIVDTRRLVFHLSVVVFCLVSAVRAVEANKWR